MKINELKQLNDAPQKGHILAYFRQGIVFEEYSNLNVLVEGLTQREDAGDELLELHLFDQNKEYRCISTRSKRYPEGVIEHIADFKNDTEITVFMETVSLEKGKGMLSVLNNIRYQEDNGMAVVEDYRQMV